MASNRDVAAAREYHEATKHSFASIRTDMHYLDWANQPHPFKLYSDLPAITLPRDFPHPSAPTLEALGGTSEETDAAKPLDLVTLAEILFFSGGLTKRATLANGEAFYFRAAACAGGLYPIEFYVVCGPLRDLAAGVYHFAPLDFALHRLREGDARGALAEASQSPTVGQRPATIVLSAMTWRSSWKYQARSYRYHFWDAGTILANLLATARAAHQGTEVVVGFVDAGVNHLLGVDGRHEVALALVPLGRPGAGAPGVEPLPSIEPRVEPQYPREVVYPLITAMHSASALRTPDEVRAWRTALASRPGEPSSTATLPLQEGGRPLGEVIFRRGSSRAFHRDPIGYTQLSTILAASTAGLRADFLPDLGSSLVDLYLIVNAVEGIPSGSYFYQRAGQRLESLRQGNFRNQAGYLCLEQDLGADAAAVVFFLSNLEAVLERFGNRGYRATQLEAGILGGRMYLAAYTLRLGATGLTFYDDDVVDFFSPHAQGKDAIFVVALGRGARARSIRLRPMVASRSPIGREVPSAPSLPAGA